MLSLPVVFLCNAVVFLLLMEERFKVIASLAVTAAAFVLSLISGGVVGSLFNDPAVAGKIGVAVSVFWCVLASVFIASNSIVQKLFLALLLLLNYLYAADFIPQLLGILPFGTAGIGAVLIGNGVYLLFTLLVAALLAKPLHYFYRRGVCPSGIFLCLMAAAGIFLAMGAANAFFSTESFALRFFLVFLVYVFLLYTLRAVYAGARYKARDVLISSEARVREVRARSYENMLANVESFRNAKNNVQYAFKRIGALADAGKTQEISSYVNLALANDRDAPLLGRYCEDPYVNALVATRAAQAEEEGVTLECSIALNGLKLKTAELCVILDDLLLSALADCSKAGEEKYVRLNVLPSGDKVTVEAVNTAAPELKKPLRERTAADFLREFFQEEDEEEDRLSGVKEVLERHSGSINISHTQGERITRVGIQ